MGGNSVSEALWAKEQGPGKLCSERKADLSEHSADTGGAEETEQTASPSHLCLPATTPNQEPQPLVPMEVSLLLGPRELWRRVESGFGAENEEQAAETEGRGRAHLVIISTNPSLSTLSRDASPTWDVLECLPFSV